MSGATRNQASRLHRLWAIPLVAIGGLRLFEGIQGALPHHVLLDAGMLLGGLFALRHNLMDLSPAALNAKRIGHVGVALLLLAVVLVLAGLAVALMA